MKDFNIRILLKALSLKPYVDDPECKVVEELSLPVAKARIDIAVINGYMHAFEIKSAADSLRRLPGQIEAYSLIFDFITIVSESKYCEKLMELLPPWVGILICSEHNDKPHFKIVREPLFNSKKQGFFLAKLLWKKEMIEILESQFIPFRKVDTCWKLAEIIEKEFDIDQLSHLVREKLKSRPEEWKYSITANCEAE